MRFGLRKRRLGRRLFAASLHRAAHPLRGGLPHPHFAQTAAAAPLPRLVAGRAKGLDTAERNCLKYWDAMSRGGAEASCACKCIRHCGGGRKATRRHLPRGAETEHRDSDGSAPALHTPHLRTSARGIHKKEAPFQLNGTAPYLLPHNNCYGT